MTEARIPNDYVIGQQGTVGVAHNTVFERVLEVSKAPLYRDKKEKLMKRKRNPKIFQSLSQYLQRAGKVDLIEDHARKKRETDPLFDKKSQTSFNTSSWGMDSARARATRKRNPGAEGSIGKLMSSNVARQANKTHSMIAGIRTATGLHSSYDGVIAEILCQPQQNQLPEELMKSRRISSANEYLDYPENPNR